MNRAARLLIVCLLALAGAAGCGGGSSAAGGPDPANAVPANAGIYLEGVVRPQGDQRDDALAAAGKVLGTPQPEKKLRELWDQNAKGKDGKPISWDSEVAPWLGERVGVWVNASAGQGDHFAAVIAIAHDKDKARTAIKRGQVGERKASYHGVDYTVDSAGQAEGIVGDFAVVGSEPEFKRVVDTTKDRSLAENARFKDAIGKLDENRLGTFFVDVNALVDAGLRANPAGRQQLEQFKQIFPIDQLGPITGAFEANGDRMKLDSSITGQGAETLSRFGLLTGAGSTKLIGEVPGDAWAAYGIPNVGKTAASLFDRFAGALGGSAVTSQFQQATGLDLRRDVFDLLGDVAIWLRGSTQSDLDGAMVVAVRDDSRAKRVFDRLVVLLRRSGGASARPTQVAGAQDAVRLALPNAPKPLVLARSAGKLVVAYGKPAAAATFKPQTKLRDTDLYQQAKAALDGKFDPAFVISMAGILKVVDANGSGSTDPGFQRARPYLERLTAIASGGKAGDNRYDATLGVGLR